MASIGARKAIPPGCASTDHVGGRKPLPEARMLDLAGDPGGIPLKSGTLPILALRHRASCSGSNENFCKT